MWRHLWDPASSFEQFGFVRVKSTSMRFYCFAHENVRQFLKNYLRAVILKLYVIIQAQALFNISDNESLEFASDTVTPSKSLPLQTRRYHQMSYRHSLARSMPWSLLFFRFGTAFVIFATDSSISCTHKGRFHTSDEGYLWRTFELWRGR